MEPNYGSHFDWLTCFIVLAGTLSAGWQIGLQEVVQNLLGFGGSHQVFFNVGLECYHSCQSPGVCLSAEYIRGNGVAEKTSGLGVTSGSCSLHSDWYVV